LPAGSFRRHSLTPSPSLSFDPYASIHCLLCCRLDNVIEHWHGDPQAGQARLMIDAVPQFKVSGAKYVGLHGWGCRIVPAKHCMVCSGSEHVDAVAAVWL
jgi:hypothetical protein